MENVESTLPIENNEGENGDVTGFSCKRRKLSSWLKSSRQASLTETVSLEEKVKGEIGAYKKLPRADVELDSLKWWRVHISTYPILGMVAKKYSASSSASERVFSTSGHIVSKKRCYLKPHKMNIIIISISST